MNRLALPTMLFPAALLVLGAMTVRADTPPPAANPPAPPAVAGMMAGLNLTDAQRAAFQDAMQQRHEMMRSLRGEHEKIRAMSQADNFDEAKIRDLVRKNETGMENSIVSSAKAMHDFYVTLTPDQKAKLAADRKQVRDQLRARMKERMKNHLSGEAVDTEDFPDTDL